MNDSGHRRPTKKYRGVCGKLSWLVDQRRPDLAYDVIELTMHKKDAKLSLITVNWAIIRI